MPTSSGTVADQLLVPEAVPESPVELVHFTAATPTLSVAVPLTAMETKDVATTVNAGETILSDGGVVSGLVGGVTTGGVTTGGTTTGGTTTGGTTTGGTTGGTTTGGTTTGGTGGGATAGPYSA